MRKLTTSELLNASHEIALRYRGMGLDMTLRQLYYQLVATGQIHNNDKSYKRLGGVLTRARYEGRFPLDLLVDRTRTVNPGAYVCNDDSIDDALRRARQSVARFPDWFLSRGRWFGQPHFVTVMVEKEALAGVFERPCEDLGVASLVCRGYPSVSALNAWVTSFARALDAYWSERYAWQQPNAIILYFGDHDPDGLQIPKSLLESCQELLRLRSEEFPGYEDEVPGVELVNCALTLEQIEHYGPPPFPAKPSSSRFKCYHEDTGLSDAWELDALPPDVLDALVREHVEQWFNARVHEQNQQLIESRREAFASRLGEVLNA